MKLHNNMDLLKTIPVLNGLTNLVSGTQLASSDNENRELPNTDRIQTDSAEASNITTQSAVNVVQRYITEEISQLPSATKPESGERNVEKFVLLGTFVWATTDGYGKELVVAGGSTELPLALMNLRYPLGRQAQPFTHIHSDFEFMLTMNPNPGYRGAVVLVYRPKDARFEMDSFPNFPHVILNCSVNSGATLKVPYIAATPYVGKSTNANGKVYLQVLSELKMATGSSTSIDLALYARAVKVKLIGPVALREAQSPENASVRILENQGCMFMSSVQHTENRPNLALREEQTKFDVKTAVGDSEYKDLKDVCQIPSVYARFDWNGSFASGHKIFTARLRLIDILKTNIGFISSHFSGWTGSIQIMVQIFASKLTQGRLLVSWVPTVAIGSETADFEMTEASNTFYTVVDIGLNSTFVVTLPFLSEETIRNHDEYFGRLSFFVLNRLTYTAASPQNLGVVVYIYGASDFKLYFPLPSFTFQGPPEPVGSFENTGAQDVIGTEPTFENVRPITMELVSESHSLLRNCLGRAWYIDQITLGSMSHSVFALSPQNERTMYNVAKLFMYYNGSFNLHIITTDGRKSVFAHSYIDASAEELRTLFALGAVVQHDDNPMEFKVPFYWRNPVHTTRQLGYFHVYSHDGCAIIYSGSVNDDTSFHVLQSPPTYTPSARMGLRTTVEGGVESYIPDEVGMSEREYESLRQQEDFSFVDYGVSKLKIAQSGDVEENPGPAKVVRKDRGLYHHWGIVMSNNVIHLDSDDVIGVVASGGKPTMKCDPYIPCEWDEIEEVDLCEEVLIKRADDFFHAMEVYNWEYNCETFVNTLLQKECGSFSKGLKVTLFVLVVGASASLMCPQGVRSTFISLLTGVKHKTVENVMQFHETLSVFLVINLLDGLKGAIVKSCVRGILKVVCYGILLAQNPSISTIVALSTLCILDIQGPVTVDEVMQTVENTVSLEAENIGQGLPWYTKAKEILKRGPPKKLQGPPGGFKKFNEISTSAKNFEWWIAQVKNFFSWLKGLFCEDKVEKAEKMLSENSNEIVDLLTRCSSLFVSVDPETGLLPGSYLKEWQEKVKELNKWICIASPLFGDKRLIALEKARDNMMKMRIEHEDDSEMGLRVEPVCVHICGAPGIGKTLLMQRLACNLAHRLGSAVYTHPMGSQYMDGYNGQKVHVFDDFLQTSAEEEVALFINLVSSAPFKVPAASLEQKGQYYKGEIILTSSNTAATTEHALKCPDAVKRRVIQVDLELRPQYKIRKNGVDQLFMTKARSDGVFENGKCWLKKLEQGNWEEMDFKLFVDWIYTLWLSKKRQLLKTREMFAADIKAGFSAYPLAKDKVSCLGGMAKVLQGPPEEEYDVSMEGIDTPRDLIEEVPAVFTGSAEAYQAVYGKNGSIFAREGQRIREEILQEVRQQEMASWLGVSDEDYDAVCGSVPDVRVDSSEPVFGNKPLVENVPLKKDWERWTSEVKENNESLKKWALVIGVVSAVVSAVAAVSWMVSTFTKEKPVEDQRAYAPTTKPPELKVIPQYVKEHQGVNEFLHLFRNMCKIRFGTTEITGFGLRDQVFVTYKHGFLSGDFDLITHTGVISLTPDDVRFEQVYVESGPTDLLMVTILKPLGFKFVDQSKSLAKPQYFCGGLRLGMKEGLGVVDEVKNLLNRSYQVYTSGARGFGHVEYFGTTHCGDCGDLIIQKIYGCWKVVAMHTGAAYGQCCGVKMHLALDVLNKVKEPQGVIVQRERAPVQIHVASKTKLKPSCLNGVWEKKKEPAVLRPRDERMSEKKESILKNNLEKFSSNRFKVDEYVFEAVKAFLIRKLKVFVQPGKCVSPEEAIQGLDGNALDLDTSPGYKFVVKGKRKKDFIILEDGKYVLKPEFKNLVLEKFEKLKSGQCETTFMACLKDELRPLEKIMEGKTRTIEACEVDYTVLYRMVMATIYRDLYVSSPLATGIAVGLDCLGSGDMFLKFMSGARQYFQCDFSGFDGKLPLQLMEHGVDVLCSLHEEPDLVRCLHVPILKREMVAMDEMWYLEGGMPSGAPCTSILNSICNWMATQYMLLQCGGSVVLEDYRLIVYGDDVLAALPDQDLVLEENVVQCMKDSFGLDCTPSSKKKGDSFTVDFNSMEFLKRKVVFHKDLNKFVMALDLDTIQQSLMWRRSMYFQEQLDCLTLELSQWGREIYEKHQKDCTVRLQTLGYDWPSYESVLVKLRKMKIGVDGVRKYEKG
uniref:Genome polyprotein n=1 Tax=Western African lungfish picornavirus TaxID=2116204 RepID=A0A2P1GNL5_9VIRU|nr:polyprotein [Western African lungfish picornavirus]